MYRYIKVIKAEGFKQFKNQMHSNWIVFSMLLWPVLAFASAYFQFKPFQFDSVFGSISYLNDNNLLTYIMIGYFAMIFFRSFVQSAWRFSYERTSGTLELIYLSPASRMAVMLGNALASLVTSVWMFVVFMLGIFVFFNKVHIVSIWVLTFGVMIMLIMSILWGMLMNSMFLFTRDSGMLFTILEEPMELFAGVKIPVMLFPFWAKLIGFIFPLTYSIRMLREIVFLGKGLNEMSGLIYTCLIICITMFILTVVILHYGERYNSKTGNMTLF